MFLAKIKKSPFYQIVYERSGKRTSKSTGETDRLKAEQFLNNFNPQNDVVTNTPASSIAEKQSIKLSKFRDEYLKYCERGKSKNYIKSIKLSFRHLQLFINDISVSQISSKLLDNFITSTYSGAPHSAHLYYRTLKAAFSKAVTWDYLSENPFKKFNVPKVAKSYPVFISEIEFNLILKCTDEEYLRNLFCTAFYTGMRLGEIVNMKWDWISFPKQLIKIKCNGLFSTKNKKERIIPINDFLLQQLYEMRPEIVSIKNSRYVFTRIKDIKLNEDYVSKLFKKAVRKSGLSDTIHFHTLRHSFASNLVQNGISLYVIKELLGHEDLKTTQIYSHLESNNLLEAVNSILRKS